MARTLQVLLARLLLFTSAQLLRLTFILDGFGGKAFASAANRLLKHATDAELVRAMNPVLKIIGVQIRTVSFPSKRQPLSPTELN